MYICIYIHICIYIYIYKYTSRPERLRTIKRCPEIRFTIKSEPSISIFVQTCVSQGADKVSETRGLTLHCEANCLGHAYTRCG